MTDLSHEPELDLPRPVGTEQPRKRRTAFAGLSVLQLAALAILLAALAWGMWVTCSLLSPPSQQRIVAVKLSGLVGEYIQAQARSASPPDHRLMARWLCAPPRARRSWSRKRSSRAMSRISPMK